MAKEAIKITTFENTKLNVCKLDWKEVYYTNCPLISASNVDQELGWTREEYKKLGVNYDYFRSNRETDWYPHYIHNQDNLIRFGGLFPPVHVHADIRRTRLLGVTHAPTEGGVMMVRSRDDIYRMSDLKGKKIGLSKSMNQIKNDWWRIQEHQGIELMFRMNGMTMDDIELVEFPYADDWYNDPKMLAHYIIHPTYGCNAIINVTWLSVRWKLHLKKALLMPVIHKVNHCSNFQKQLVNSKPLKIFPGIQTGLYRWQTFRQPLHVLKKCTKNIPNLLLLL